MNNKFKGEIIICNTNEGLGKIDFKMVDETVWLNLDQMAELFDRNKSTISKHIKNIYEDEELERTSTVAKYATVQIEGNREIERQIEYYNLDVIISVGYRVRSKVATKFRMWATDEYKKYQAKTISPVENAYLETIKDVYKIAQSKKE